MKKIISLFARNYDGDRLVRNEIVPGAEWVQAGEGIATQKFDGTSCLFQEGMLWKRYEVKSGKPYPPRFVASQAPDKITGDVPGWVPVSGGREDRWHREALHAAGGQLEEGTYELCGPKVQKNPEGYTAHKLVRHGSVILPDAPRTFQAIRTYLRTHNIEGIVWHHEDGRMVKIKARDFGLRRFHDGQRRADNQMSAPA